MKNVSDYDDYIIAEYSHVGNAPTFILKIKSLAYSSQGSHTDLQLTGKWQYDGIMWLALRSVKSNIVVFLNQIRYFSIPRSRCNPHLKFVEVPGICSQTRWPQDQRGGLFRGIQNQIRV